MTMQLAALLMIGAVGGVIGAALKVPGGTLIGAMAAVIIFKAFGHGDYTTPRMYIYIVQVLVGVMVGVGYSPEMAGVLGRLIVPVLTSTLVLVGAGLIMGLAVARMLALDPVTGYLATSPGAMSSLIALAAEVKAQPAVVAAFHFFRLVFILLTAPLLLKLVQLLSRGGG